MYLLMDSTSTSPGTPETNTKLEIKLRGYTPEPSQNDKVNTTKFQG